MNERDRQRSESRRRAAALLLAVLLGSPAAWPRSPRGPLSLGGAGGSEPSPPIGLQPAPSTAPVPPDLGTVGRGAIVLVVVEREPVKREVRLRTAAGQLAGRALTDSRGVAVLTVPSGEAWLVDVVGTEAVAVPVLSGDVVRVVLGG